MRKIYLISKINSRNIGVDSETNDILMDLRKRTGLRKEDIITAFLQNILKVSIKNNKYIIRTDKPFKLYFTTTKYKIPINEKLYNKIKELSEITDLSISRIVKAAVIYNYENVEII